MNPMIRLYPKKVSVDLIQCSRCFFLKSLAIFDWCLVLVEIKINSAVGLAL